MIGITMGDPAGIGPEVILKSLRGVSFRQIRLIGSRRVFEQEQARLGTKFNLDKLIDDVVGKPGRYSMGEVQKRCGQAALKSLDAGIELLKHRKLAALVTAPVSKQALRLAGFRWPGQTELLAHRLGAKKYAMLAYTRKFKAVLVTTHLPLRYTSRYINASAIAEKAALIGEFLKRQGIKNPRVGIMAYNPHGFEFSVGEEKRIQDGIRRARRKGINATGPIPSDALFARLSEFDGFVAMYHDQAMIPAKIYGIKSGGVNVTLGLGRIRTSPLHGVAFDIAGKDKASALSMQAAIRLAQKLVR